MSTETTTTKGASTAPYAARAFNAAHPELPNGAGVPARLANERYVESLARVVYYWGYPAIDAFGRTSGWEVMNDLSSEPVVLQTPNDVPKGHYWTIQIADLFTTVIHQLGSASNTPGGKFLLVGPHWTGQKPNGFIDVLRSPTNVAGVFGRSFAAHSDEAKAKARAVLNQIGMVGLSKDKPRRHTFDCEASARNKVYPPGLTAEMLAADPDMLRVRPVNPVTFWDDLEKALDANPEVGSDDAAMAAQARTLMALRDSDASWKALLDRAVLAADADLQDGARYSQTGVEAGNGWQRQENGGAWGTDWFGRAQAAVVYIYVNDYHEAIYFIRGTDAKGQLLQDGIATR